MKSSTNLLFITITRIQIIIIICTLLLSSETSFAKSTSPLIPTMSFSTKLSSTPYTATTNVNFDTFTEPELQKILKQIPSSLQTQSDDESCEKCSAIMQLFIDFFDDNQTLPPVAVEIVCAASFPPDKDLPMYDLCHEIGNYGIQIVNWVFHHSLNWAPSTYCAYLKQCRVDCCTTDNIPEQIITTFGQNETQRHFSWTTRQNITQYLLIFTSPLNNDNNNDDDEQQQQQQQHPDMLQKTERFKSIIQTYDMGNWQGFIHRVTINNLQHNTTYYYKMGMPNKNIWGPTYHFKIPPKTVGTDYVPLKIIVFGDMDLTPASLTTRQVLLPKLFAQNDIHGVILAGDNGYIDGQEKLWQGWMGFLEQTFTSRGIALMTVIGNHETVPNMISFTKRFPHYTGEPRIEGTPYGLTTLGKFFAVYLLNSENTFLPSQIDFDKVQFAWMNDTLSKNTNYIWKIAVLHRPLYCNDESGGAICVSDADFLKQNVEDSFLQYGIDMTFTGHIHQYLRTTAMSHNKPVTGQCVDLHKAQDFVSTICQQGKPVHFVVGNGGNSHSPVERPSTKPSWVSQDWYKAGIGLITVVDDFLQHEFFDSATGNLVDIVVTQKKKKNKTIRF